MAHVRVARAELARLRTSMTLLEELEHATSRRQSERELTRHLARLGAILQDALGQGHEAVQRLIAELTAGAPDLGVEPARLADLRGEAQTARSGATVGDELVGESTSRRAATTRVIPELAIATPGAVPATAGVVEVTADVRAQLRAALKAGSQGSRPSEVRVIRDHADGADLPAITRDQRAHLERIAAFIAAEPNNLRGPRPIEAEVTRLESLFRETATTWAPLGRTLNHALVTYFAAAARRVQAIAERELRGKAGARLKARIQPLFPQLTRHSLETQPGAAQGLAQHHKPQGGDWNNDAQTARTNLDLLYPEVDWFQSKPPDLPPSVETSKTLSIPTDEAIRLLRRKVARGLTGEEFVGELWVLKL